MVEVTRWVRQWGVYQITLTEQKDEGGNGEWGWGQVRVVSSVSVGDFWIHSNTVRSAPDRQVEPHFRSRGSRNSGDVSQR